MSSFLIPVHDDAIYFPPDRNPVILYLTRLSPNSVPTMQYGLRRVCQYLTYGWDAGVNDEVDIYSFPWDKLELSAIQLVRNALIKDYSISTANVYLVGLRGVIKACWRLGLITQEEYARRTDFEGASGSDPVKGRSLSREEIRALLATCYRETRRDIRDAAILVVMISTGMRREELTNLRVEHLHKVDDPDGEIYVVDIYRGKGNKSRTVFISASAKHYLDRWLALQNWPTTGYVFHSTYQGHTDSPFTTQTVYDILKYRSELAELERVSPHDLRRTFITSLLENGVDVLTVQKLAGHSSLQTTQRYDRRSSDVMLMAAKTISWE